jgi:DNA polymerase-3 subunit beta
MRFTLDQPDMARALALAASIAPSKPEIPVLGHALLEASPGQLRVTASDLKLQVSLTIPANVIMPGRVLAHADRLHDIAKLTPPGAEVAFDAEDDAALKVSAGRSRYRVATWRPTDDFPVMTGNDMPATIDCEAEDLARLLNRVAFAASVDDTRYYINGVNLHQGDRVNTLRAAATNTLALAWAELQLDDPAPEVAVTVPRPAVSIIQAMLGKARKDDPVGLCWSPIRVRFWMADAEVICRAIDPHPPYPAYRNFIPTDNPVRFKVERKLMIEMSHRAMIGSGDRAVAYDLESGQLRAYGARADTGEDAADEIEADYDGPDLNFVVDGSRMVACLEQVDGDQVEIRTGFDGAPLLMSAPGQEDHLVFSVVQRRGRPAQAAA